jgi:hypothetical protein
LESCQQGPERAAPEWPLLSQRFWSRLDDNESIDVGSLFETLVLNLAWALAGDGEHRYFRGSLMEIAGTYARALKILT